MKLEKLAKGQRCEMRAPGICIDHDGSTVVLAHYRLAGLCGVGAKPHSLIAGYLCHECHSLADGRIPRNEFSKLEIRLMHAEGVLRTIDKLVRAGKVTVK